MTATLAFNELNEFHSVKPIGFQEGTIAIEILSQTFHCEQSFFEVLKATLLWWWLEIMTQMLQWYFQEADKWTNILENKLQNSLEEQDIIYLTYWPKKNSMKYILDIKLTLTL